MSSNQPPDIDQQKENVDPTRLDKSRNWSSNDATYYSEERTTIKPFDVIQDKRMSVGRPGPSEQDPHSNEKTRRPPTHPDVQARGVIQSVINSDTRGHVDPNLIRSASCTRKEAVKCHSSGPVCDTCVTGNGTNVWAAQDVKGKARGSPSHHHEAGRPTTGRPDRASKHLREEEDVHHEAETHSGFEKPTSSNEKTKQLDTTKDEGDFSALQGRSLAYFGFSQVEERGIGSSEGTLSVQGGNSGSRRENEEPEGHRRKNDDAGSLHSSDISTMSIVSPDQGRAGRASTPGSGRNSDDATSLHSSDITTISIVSPYRGEEGSMNEGSTMSIVSPYREGGVPRPGTSQTFYDDASVHPSEFSTTSTLIPPLGNASQPDEGEDWVPLLGNAAIKNAEVLDDDSATVRGPTESDGRSTLLTLSSRRRGPPPDNEREPDDDVSNLNRSRLRRSKHTCENCRAYSHVIENCDVRNCFKCRRSVPDWSIGALMHPEYCQDAFKGFMQPYFEGRKNDFYCYNKHSVYKPLPELRTRRYYRMLSALSPENEYRCGYDFEEIFPYVDGFGNMGGRSLIIAYQLLWKKLVVTDSFELDLFKLEISLAHDATITTGRETIIPFELTFTIKDRRTEDYARYDRVYEEQCYLKRKLIYNGVYGFPIFICLREHGQRLVDQETDREWPDNVLRKQISPLRIKATVFRCYPPTSSNRWTLIIEPVKALRTYLSPKLVPPNTIYLAFNHRADELKREIEELKMFIDSPLRGLTFPENLYEMVENFYDPIVRSSQIYSYMEKKDLEEFNELLPEPYRLYPEQMLHAITAYQNEMHAILGPSGSGKTTILCFLAIFNWFVMGRRTLLITTRRGAANDMTLRVVRMSKYLLGLPKFQHLANGQQYIWYKMEKDSLMEPRDPEIEAVSSFDHDAPEQVTMLVTLLNSVSSDVVRQIKSDHVLLDEASTVGTVNFYMLLITLNRQRRHLPQHLSIFGDQFQSNARFSKENFLSDFEEMKGGFNESALVQLLKCKLPYSQMSKVVRSSKALINVIQPFYDFDLSTAHAPRENPVTICFSDCVTLCDLKNLQDRQFVSLFINLPPRDTNENHYCDADEVRERMSNCRRGPNVGRTYHKIRSHENGRQLAYSNKRNVYYAVNVLNSVLKNNKDLEAKDCMYLTPYRFQESEFYHRRARPARTLDVRGQTIDRAISIEAGFVLIDLVRTSPEGFMNGQPEDWPAYSTAHRLLSGLSRAIRAQVIIGSTLLDTGSPIGRLAIHHKNSRDPMVAFIDVPGPHYSRDYFQELV